MKFREGSKMRFSSILVLLILAIPADAQTGWKTVNPEIQSIVDSVSNESLESMLRRLEAFETRNTMSDPTSPRTGIGAARQWIYDQFKSFSPRLEVSFDTHQIPKGGRIYRDVELRNVIAVLPGTDPIGKNRRFIISGHYDSISETSYTAGSRSETKAPGVNDDGSGTAAVLEAARVLSKFEFPHTLVFAAFAGEEQGLIGSSRLARRAKDEHWMIDGVLNNDIVGNSVGGSGKNHNQTLRVFSEEPNDSPSRQIARYVKEAGERYTPAVNVDLIFRHDRFRRGGDHTSFNRVGFPGVRITVAEENYSRQHTLEDTLEGIDLNYLSRAVRINVASLASLAKAPSAPKPGALGRQPSGYDANLKWEPAEGNPAGYIVVMRKTTSPLWEKELYVGNALQLVLKDVSIDEWVFGVRAIGKDGSESLTSVWTTSAAP
jgi:hypothetical protein